MTNAQPVVVGVLALQGAFREHIEYLQKAVELDPVGDYAFEFPEIKTPEQLARCQALVIPGGESTAISLIAERTHMLEPLQQFVALGYPVWGTCAGLIFLATSIKGGRAEQKLLGGIDIEVTRNAFGRQLDSFETDLVYEFLTPGPFETVFIRAPVVTAVGPSDASAKDVIVSENPYKNPAPVEILKTVTRKDQELVVAVRQGNKLGTSFHPELSNEDYRFHRWFITEFVLTTV